MVDAARPSVEYTEMSARWKRMRDCVAGGDAVKGAGVVYLPALMGHQIPGGRLSSEYTDYKTRALFYNVTGRSVDGLSGMVFRRPPIADLPGSAEALTADVDLLGRSLDAFADACLREVLTVGRAGVLVDHTVAPVEQPVEPAEPPRPYFTLYATESILDVVHRSVGGVRQLAQVRLHEVHEEPDPTDEFGVIVVERVRVLELDEAGSYFQRVFMLVGGVDGRGRKTSTWFEEEPVFPRLPDGRPMRAIPFFLLGTGSAHTPGHIEPPPLLDLADVNLAHYRTDADLRAALHMAGVPTPVFIGISAPTADQPPVRLGSMEGIFLPQPGSDAKFLAFSDTGGVNALREALQDLESQAAFLGARMLAPEKRAAETAETARIHRQGEISVLGRMSNIISAQLTIAVKVMLAWAGIVTAAEHRFKLNDDFLPTQAPPQLLAEMVKAWQGGAISHDSLWLFMQEGELVDPRRTIEAELKIIEEETPEPEAEEQELGLETQRLTVEQQRVAIEQQKQQGGEQEAA